MIVSCFECGHRDDSDYMSKIDSPSRKYFYLCDSCMDQEYCYSTPNNTRKNKQAKHGLTYGIEFETSERNEESNILYQYGFIPTGDCSIGGTEWKSPIYGSLSGLRKMFRSIEDVVWVGDDAGTHLNIGTFTSEEMDYIRRFYHSLFIPLCEEMKHRDWETEELFGRFFCDYASEIYLGCYPCGHSNFINVESSNRLEFRICKFISADQYLRCMKMCSEMVKAIRNNFLNHFNKYGEKNKTKFRKHKAKIAAGKMVRIFQKYADKL